MKFKHFKEQFQDEGPKKTKPSKFKNEHRNFGNFVKQNQIDVEAIRDAEYEQYENRRAR